MKLNLIRTLLVQTTLMLLLTGCGENTDISNLDAVLNWMDKIPKLVWGIPVLLIFFGFKDFFDPPVEGNKCIKCGANVTEKFCLMCGASAIVVLKNPEADKKPTKQEYIPMAKRTKAYSSFNLDTYTWKKGMPKPKKEDVGLDSNVQYPHEFTAVEAYDTRMNIMQWIAAIILCIPFFIFIATRNEGYSPGWFLLSLGLIILCRIIIGLWSVWFHDSLFRKLVHPHLYNLMKYESAHAEFMRVIGYEQERIEKKVALELALEREKKAALEAKEKVWREALAKKTAIHDRFTGKGNYRPNARELLSILDSKTGEDLEIIVLGILWAKGWKMILTGRGADGGIDLEGVRQIRNRETKIAVQVKHWEGNVTEKAVRDFWGASTGLYDEALFVTSSDFNGPAMRFKDKRATGSGTTLRYWAGSQLQAEIDQLTDKNFQEMIDPLQTKLAKNALGEEALRPLLDDTQGDPVRRRSSGRRRGPSCPLCDSSMSIQFNKNDNSRFYGCVKFRWFGCKGTINIDP
ncbi:restriction endonuclease [SAR202 cluster bacterium AC-409-J13_OGT_754m]|nr:restriction endonuclease [SAR202 cluster bacterium AC-409-J13_OGT_754m]